MITCLSGSDCGVVKTDKHQVVEWRGKGRVVFSMSQLGNGMDAHFAADKDNLRYIKTAINEFCDWVFNNYKWCTLIFAVINKPSVERIVRKCGFKYLTHDQDKIIYIKVK